MAKFEISSKDAKIIRKSLNLFFLFFLLFGAVLGGLVAVFYQSQINTFLSELKSHESHTIELQSRTIGHEFTSIVSDLLFLTEQNELTAFLRSKSPATITDIEQEYLGFADRKKVYDQIRYLNETGMEVVRVNYNQGQPVAVSQASLQDKSRRYYFSDAFRLEQGEVFVSPLDLNIEGGKIEQPLKPMIRFGTPVFDGTGTKRGIVLINYLAKSMLETVHQASDPDQGSPMLLNNQGYWLLSHNPADEWGFMIEERADRNFARDYPEEWAAMLASNSGQMNTANGLFTFTRIFPLQESFRSSSGSTDAYAPSVKELDPSQYFWVLLSYIPPAVMKSYMHNLQFRLFMLGAGLFVVISLGAWLLALAITKRRIYQSQLISMALYDTLTGLPNRKLFFDQLESGIEHARRHERRLGLLFIDLDGFKSVNDTMGHEAGDDLLIEVGRIMRSATRRSDTVARLGGDEFAIILFEVRSEDCVARAGEKIIAVLSERIKFKVWEVTIGASIGGAIFPDTSTEADSLVKYADQAMYQSKAKGKNTFTLAKADGSGSLAKAS